MSFTTIYILLLFTVRIFILILFLYVVQTINSQIFKVQPSKGLTETLRLMKKLEKLSFQNPYFIKFVHDTFSNKCIPCIPGEIWKFIRKNFKYKNDSYDETLTAPYILLQTKTGDCDDFALFTKTVLDILGGWNTYYLLLGELPNQFSHIIVRADRHNGMFKVSDRVYIDGANEAFNSINNKYHFRLLKS